MTSTASTSSSSGGGHVPRQSRPQEILGRRGSRGTNELKPRKPSYVGLSCAVSGYSPSTRYTSPNGRIAKTPSQFPVSSPPHTLDSVSLVLSNMRQINGGGGSSSRGHDCADRGYFAGMDSAAEATSPTSATNGGSGNLVQKQIERLYGGKVETVRAASPPDPDSGVSSPPEEELLNKATNGKVQQTKKSSFFSRRFGRSSNSSDEKSRNNNNDPDKGSSSGGRLDFKPLKVPAVFKLLRPEFREQLKSNSCQIPPTEASSSSPATATGQKERVVPIQREDDDDDVAKDRKPPTPKERIIPVRREEATRVEIPIQRTTSPENRAKPALPTKPASPLQSPGHSVAITSPSLVSAAENSKSEEKLTEKEPEVAEVVEDVNAEDEEDDLIRVSEEYEAVGGVHEPTQLCTILEEDGESTAGSQLNLIKTNKDLQKQPDQQQPPQQQSQQPEVKHDGHYFIRLLENETFKFEEQICDFEEFASDQSVPEDVRDSILAAIGKAKLLMAQKLAQFRGLCEKNITLKVEDDPFVPTNDDLAGFWDMVYIQVEHVHSLFAELVQIKENGWKRTESLKSSNGGSPSPSIPLRNGNSSSGKKSKASPSTRKSPASPSKKKSTPTSEAAKARDEARKKMMEERKRQMRLKKEAEEGKTAAEAGEDNSLFIQF